MEGEREQQVRSQFEPSRLTEQQAHGGGRNKPDLPPPKTATLGKRRRKATPFLDVSREFAKVVFPDQEFSHNMLWELRKATPRRLIVSGSTRSIYDLQRIRRRWLLAGSNTIIYFSREDHAWVLDEHRRGLGFSKLDWDADVPYKGTSVEDDVNKNIRWLTNFWGGSESDYRPYI